MQHNIPKETNKKKDAQQKPPKDSRNQKDN